MLHLFIMCIIRTDNLNLNKSGLKFISLKQLTWSWRILSPPHHGTSYYLRSNMGMGKYLKMKYKQENKIYCKFAGCGEINSWAESSWEFLDDSISSKNTTFVNSPSWHPAGDKKNEFPFFFLSAMLTQQKRPPQFPEHRKDLPVVFPGIISDSHLDIPGQMS